MLLHITIKIPLKYFILDLLINNVINILHVSSTTFPLTHLLKCTKFLTNFLLCLNFRITIILMLEKVLEKVWRWHDPLIVSMRFIMGEGKKLRPPLFLCVLVDSLIVYLASQRVKSFEHMIACYWIWLLAF